VNVNGQVASAPNDAAQRPLGQRTLGHTQYSPG
jgi:hypothetical protein